jgi:quercetin dioxygenase-like cupin family protein
VSLVEVADATGISRSFLSLVENGHSDITIGRLLRLVNFYGAHISDLFPHSEPDDPIVVRHGQQRELASPAEGIRIFLLAPDMQRNMTPSLALLEPTGQSAENASHEGEEFVYVLEGEIALLFGDSDPTFLSAGDGAYFKAERPHSYKNLGKTAAQFLTVATPPTF